MCPKECVILATRGLYRNIIQTIFFIKPYTFKPQKSFFNILLFKISIESIISINLNCFQMCKYVLVKSTKNIKNNIMQGLSEIFSFFGVIIIVIQTLFLGRKALSNIDWMKYIVDIGLLPSLSMEKKTNWNCLVFIDIISNKIKPIYWLEWVNA